MAPNKPVQLRSENYNKMQINEGEDFELHKN